VSGHATGCSGSQGSVVTQQQSSQLVQHSCGSWSLAGSRRNCKEHAGRHSDASLVADADAASKFQLAAHWI
jgi:hypothetical protein